MGCLRVLLACLTVLFTTCAAHGQLTGGASLPERTFDHLWTTLDRNYAQFEAKRVDWDALYDVYRPQVTAETGDDELMDIMLTMVRHLNDAHVCLNDGDRRVCAGVVDELERDDFSLDLVVSSYMGDDASTALDGSFTYGWVADGVGYLHIGDFKDGPEETALAIDAVMERLADAEAMIVDVRDNPGGTGTVANAVANRFADRKRRYMTSQVRYGVSHDDFGPVRYWHVEPEGPVQFTRPTVVLTHRFSESAADIFVLAMRVLPHVTVVGDFTGGAFSAQFPERLPNGWTLWVAYKLLRDHEGICWDGIGVPPDLRIRNTREDIEAGRDRVLEFAVRLVEDGGPRPQDEASSLVALKTSLVERFARDVGEQGLDAAVAALERDRESKDPQYFLTPDEIMSLAGSYARSGRFGEAIAILEVCREAFPHVASTYSMLARAYLGVGDVEAARIALEEGESVEPMLPWEEPQFESVKTAFLKQTRGSAAAEIEAALEEGGITEAEARFSELISRRDTGPIFDEADFNRLGYELLQSGDLEAATFVLGKNVELYPDSANTYDSLAEAYMSAGRTDLAISHYQRSLELNPGNDNARVRIEQLRAE
jgi:carboxyl-terminal processing protease